MKKLRNKKKIQFKKRIAVAMVGVTIATFSSGCSFSQGTASGNLFSQVKTLVTGGDEKSEIPKEATTEIKEIAKEATTESKPYTEISKQPIELSQDEPALRYQSGQDAYILKDGKQQGVMHFNLAQRLGIWDYTNPTVVSNGIYYSYTFNLKLDFTQYFSQVESAKIEVKPELLNSKGEVIGEIANIGWNGFEQIAEIYKSNPVKNIEVCLQPTQDFSDGDYIKFNLTDTENNVVFDSVTYDVSLLKKSN